MPLSAGRIAELLAEAGLPEGVLQIVHGGKEAVEAICDHPGIEAISFVGSTKVAKVVYRRGTATLKRVLALGGAKNHLIVMPDADLEMTAGNVVASMSGCAGQRCMAASVMVAVSETDHIIRCMVEHARRMVPGKDIGPVISARGEGADRALHRRGGGGRRRRCWWTAGTPTVPGREGGYYLGPTIIDHVTPDMRIAQEEVFGPVLVIIRSRDVDEALAVENASPYGNAASVFTESGGTARYVMERASAGMVGVNVGVPVPREPFSFGGWNESKFGVGDITGRGSIEFWTQVEEDDDEVESGGGGELDVVSACHAVSPERSEASHDSEAWLLRFAQDDKRNPGEPHGYQPFRQLHRDSVRESLPALLGAADGVGEQHPSRVRGRVGRGGDQDDRAPPGRQRRRRQGQVHAHVARGRLRLHEEAPRRGAALLLELGADLRQDARLVAAPASGGSRRPFPTACSSPRSWPAPATTRSCRTGSASPATARTPARTGWSSTSPVPTWTDATWGPTSARTRGSARW